MSVDPSAPDACDPGAPAEAAGAAPGLSSRDRTLRLLHGLCADLADQAGDRNRAGRLRAAARALWG